MNVYAHATREAKRDSAKRLDKVMGMNREQKLNRKTTNGDYIIKLSFRKSLETWGTYKKLTNRKLPYSISQKNYIVLSR